MKQTILLITIAIFFSACVQNFGPGEPPYVRLIINDNEQAYDSIHENEAYTFNVSYIEENGAELNEVIVSEGKKTYTFDKDSFNNENLLIFNFEQNYNAQTDTTIDVKFVASSKNSEIISEYEFYLVISNENKTY